MPRKRSRRAIPGLDIREAESWEVAMERGNRLIAATCAAKDAIDIVVKALISVWPGCHEEVAFALDGAAQRIRREQEQEKRKREGRE